MKYDLGQETQPHTDNEPLGPFSPAAQHRARGHTELQPSSRGRRRFGNSNLGAPHVHKLQETFPSLFASAPEELQPIESGMTIDEGVAPSTQSTYPPSLPRAQMNVETVTLNTNHDLAWERTPPDSHGLFRAYPTPPSHIPGPDSFDDILDGQEFARSKPFLASNGRAGIAVDQETDADAAEGSSPTPAPGPSRNQPSLPSDSIFANPTIMRTVQWYAELDGKALTPTHFDDYIRNVIHNPDETFQASDYPQNFSLSRELDRLDNFKIPSHINGAPTFESQAGWRQVTINVPLPCTKNVTKDPPTFPVEGLHRRSIVQIIKAEFPTATSRTDFHLTPYKLLWDVSDHHPNQPHERVITEAYNSEAMIDEHIKISRAQREKGVDMEVVVAGLMFWSDSTHLAEFGTASMWPAYLGFANQSKYTRADPKTHSLHHLAYMPKASLSLDASTVLH